MYTHLYCIYVYIYIYIYIHLYLCAFYIIIIIIIIVILKYWAVRNSVAPHRRRRHRVAMLWLRGDHLSNTTCLTQVLFNSDEPCSKLWRSLTLKQRMKQMRPY